MAYVYLLTNSSNKVMYIGVTNDLKRRVYEHKNDFVDGFTKKYRVHKLVYFEEYTDVRNAIEREKQLKGWKRTKKNELVDTMNPNWDDLYERLFQICPAEMFRLRYAPLNMTVGEQMFRLRCAPLNMTVVEQMFRLRYAPLNMTKKCGVILSEGRSPKSKDLNPKEFTDLI